MARELETVRALVTLKGIDYPEGTRFRDIVVTGPEGSGKSTLVQRLGGWPEEGLIDLAANGWWRSRELSARPREVHLALPFRGLESSMALHDPAWIQRSERLELDLARVQIPAEAVRWGADWRQRCLFDFLLPSPEALFEARQQRADRRSHPGDQALDLTRCREQIEIYTAIARTLHDEGFRVLVRTEYGGPPLRFRRAARLVGVRPWLLERLWRRFVGHDAAPTLDPVERRVLRGAMVRIPRSRLPITADVGEQLVVIAPEKRLDGEPTGRVEIYDPERLDRLFGCVRLAPGEATRLGRGAEDRFITRSLPQDALPRLEIFNQEDSVLLIDLDSPRGTTIDRVDEEAQDQLLTLRRQANARLEQILPTDGRPLDPTAAGDLLGRVVETLRRNRYRPLNRYGVAGGIVALPDAIVPIVLGDLHTRLDNLLGCLCQNRFLDEIEKGRAALVILGDAVHPEAGRDLSEMASSMLVMDRILALQELFPQGVYYLLGNHDGFSSEVRKQSIPQGLRWRKELETTRGRDYVKLMKEYYAASPYLLESKHLVACHGGPPQESVTREALVDIVDHPRLRHQLTWNRLRGANNPAGYGRRDVRKLLGALGRSRASLVVAHTPPQGEHLFQRDVGGIHGHHVIHSAGLEGYSVATLLGGELALLEFENRAR